MLSLPSSYGLFHEHAQHLLVDLAKPLDAEAGLSRIMLAETGQQWFVASDARHDGEHKG